MLSATWIFWVGLIILAGVGMALWIMRRCKQTHQRFTELEETNRSLAEQLAQSNQQVSALHQNVLAISSDLELSSLLPAIVERAAKLLHTPFGGLYLIEPESLQLRLAVVYNIPEQYLGSTLSFGEGLSGRVAVSGELMMVEDHTVWDGSAQVYQGGPFRRVLAVPLKTKHGILGVLNFSDDQRTGLFREEEVRLATLFADQAAMAIENARLFDAAQRELNDRRRVEQDLQQRRNYLEHLSAITQSALQVDDFAELLQLLADRLGQTIGADGCYITLWDAAKQCVIPAAAYGPMRETYSESKVDPKEQSLTASVLQGRKVIAVEDVYNSPYISPTIAARFPSSSLLGLPLISNGELLGAALISFHQHHCFSAFEISMGEQAAGQIALAIYKARLLDELQRLVVIDDLTGIYNFRGLKEVGQRELDRALRFGRPLSAIFFDIDQFRNINNRYSHAAGNLVLQAIIRQVLQNLRAVDVVARFGGEEFVVLVPEAELAEAVGVAERLCQAVAACQVATDYGALSVTISLGVAVLSPEMTDLSALVDAANRAEHLAKENGRNRVEYFVSPVDPAFTGEI